MDKSIFREQKGFTFPELIIVMGIISMILGISAMSMLSVQIKTSLTAATDTIISDIKIQQIKAMLGITDQGLIPSDYGVYFEQDRYTLFYGSSYLPNNPDNFSIKLEQGLEFSDITFPNSTLIFTKGSGEVAGFIDGADIINLKKVAQADKKTITINRYGIITNVN